MRRVKCYTVRIDNYNNCFFSLFFDNQQTIKSQFKATSFNYDIEHIPPIKKMRIYTLAFHITIDILYLDYPSDPIFRQI